MAQQHPDPSALAELPKYIIRCAWEDRYPQGADLKQAARDSVIRYAMHFGLAFEWVHDQGVERWCRTGGSDMAATGVHGWRSEARVTGWMKRR